MIYTYRPNEKINPKGNKRKLRIKFDPAQYYTDIQNNNSNYDTFNLIIRRKPEENTFKSILETIRVLLNDVHTNAGNLSHGLPVWLQDVILGYGNPNAVHYR